MASASSSLPPQWKYDVFLSFRGADTRNGFVSHLFDALCRNHITVFKDEKLKRGEEISPALLETIEESRVSVVIFSENYANSPWCLEELSKINECRKLKGQIVLPVFYKLNPTHVQELTGSYGDALVDHGKKFKDCILESWRHALRETAGMAGFASRDIKIESKLIGEIVNNILKTTYHVYCNNPSDDGLVGIDSRIKDIESLLCPESIDVRILGIWGMPGIGKTTIASKIFDRISSQFEKRCFVANVREKLEKCTLDCLQNEILSKLLRSGDSNVVGIPIKFSSSVRRQLVRKKVLLVLDDVNDPEQIEILVGAANIFGPGSRIVITSRDKQILNSGADEILEVKALNNHEALQLLSLHAFRQNPPTEVYMKLAKIAIQYAQGIPLALKVLGSNLYNKSAEEWKDELKKLEGVSDKKIEKILRISYEDLDYNDKQIFLDIACFFKWEDKAYVESALDSCGLYARIGISHLLDKSLITIDGEEKLGMHDLLQQMGKDIVRQECMNNPRKRSRLWIPQDICNVLTKDLGKVLVQSISLDVTKIKDMELCSSVFMKMSQLRLLEFYSSNYPKEVSQYQHSRIYERHIRKSNVHLSKGLSFLLDELRYLYWFQYPSKSLPLNFCPDNLVQLHLVHSQVQQLCNDSQCLENLKVLDLSYSVNLIKIPNLSKLPKIEVLRLRNCKNLAEIHSSSCYVSKLSYVDLGNCDNLSGFPRFSYWKNLDFLCLEGCSNIIEFPEVPQNIRHLFLNGTAIQQVPSSIRHQSLLTKLSLESCTWLENLPSSIGELKCLSYLDLRRCSKLMSLPENICNLGSLSRLDIAFCLNLKGLPENLGNLESLEWLDVNESGIKELPTSINGLSKLKILTCCGCKGLKLPPIMASLSSLDWANFEDCGMTEISNCIGSLVSLEGLNLGGNNFETLPTSIKVLPKLRLLRLRNCRRLIYLPELPTTLEILEVKNCIALRSLSTIFTTKENMDSLEFLDVGNCVNLDQDEYKNFMDDLVLTLEHMSENVKRCVENDPSKYEYDVYTFYIGYCVPGGEVPRSIKNQNNSGSSLQFSLRSYPNNNTIVLAFCAVIAFDDDYSFGYRYVRCKCRFVAESGQTLTFECVSPNCFGSPIDEKYLWSDLTMMWVSCANFMKYKNSFSKASFEFFVGGDFEKDGRSNAVVIKCGVHPLSDNCDNNNLSSLTKSTWYPSFFRFSKEIEEVERLEKEEQ